MRDPSDQLNSRHNPCEPVSFPHVEPEKTRVVQIVLKEPLPVENDGYVGLFDETGEGCTMYRVVSVSEDRRTLDVAPMEKASGPSNFSGGDSVSMEFLDDDKPFHR